MQKQITRPDYHTGVMTQDDVRTLIQAGILPSGVPMSQVQVFAAVCKERGLSPFSKEIYLVGYNSKDGTVTYSTIVGIDGWRKMAKQDTTFAGVDDAKFDLKSDGSFKTSADLIIEKKKPTTATVTVYRMLDGQKNAYTHTAAFFEFNTGKQKWATMPFQMLAKVAESFAYRKAFGISGIHIPEEMGAIQDDQKPQEIPEDKLEEIQTVIDQCNSKDDFRALLKQNPHWKGQNQILKMMELRNAKIQKDEQV